MPEATATASATVQHESASMMDDYEAIYLRWLRYIKEDRLPLIAHAFREWKEIQFALQCLNLSIESPDLRDDVNPILFDAQVSLKAHLRKSETLRNEADQLAKLMQECWQAMIDPSFCISAASTDDSSRGLHTGSQQSEPHAETADSNKSKEHPYPAPPHEPSPASPSLRPSGVSPKDNSSETVIIDVDDTSSPEFPATVKRRRNLEDPLSPFVSLNDDITPPKKKQRSDVFTRAKNIEVYEVIPQQPAKGVDTLPNPPPEGINAAPAQPSTFPMAHNATETNSNIAFEHFSLPYPKPAVTVFCHIHGDVTPVANKQLAKAPFHYICSHCDRTAARIRSFCKRLHWRIDKIDRSKKSSWIIHCHCFQGHSIEGDFSFLKCQNGCPVCIEKAKSEERAKKQEMRKEDEWAQEHQRRIFATARQNLLNAATSNVTKRSLWTSGASRFDSSIAFTDADKDGQATIDSLLRCSGERNPWIVLCIGNKRSNVSYQEAKARYKKWVKRVHPDKNSHPSAKEAFHILDTAWKRIESLR
eukprot:Gregarina_sp_Poly_1__678@NODE_1161_length_4897_cov_151_311801_g684_i1_p1_GENE_NODE_1161_length_4897_cov_151_311801_g684_i1NODE_1161_length_4897_cov_151_311801_g684_i1_p1_ORF_typecomplete_len531_score73_25DnaJ/PF00226_31/1e06Enkurin/PF13864_6/1_7e02Enkurin/PF13864_6/2_7zfRING_10/PF16685_5/2_NODE_1161_length_4897_cov_151_311801_g684_i12241816